ncbi:MAG: V-type ATP synthase subunit E family protein [Eubacteriales bacterium]|nr:V-type ATP synthase subunit E family protein [Eubacteriales bacterium]
MKGTEKIIAHIRSDAQERCDAILAHAEQQCAAIRSEHEKQARDCYTAKIRAGVADCQARVDGMERIANMEAKKSVLALKQEMVAESFKKACNMIVDLPSDRYVDFLAKLAAGASVTKDEEIVLNARDKAAIGKAVAEKANGLLGGGKLTVSDEAGSFAGGLVLRRGSIEANCTAELLVELMRGEMSAELAKVLFE